MHLFSGHYECRYGNRWVVMAVTKYICQTMWGSSSKETAQILYHKLFTQHTNLSLYPERWAMQWMMYGWCKAMYGFLLWNLYMRSCWTQLFKGVPKTGNLHRSSSQTESRSFSINSSSAVSELHNSFAAKVTWEVTCEMKMSSHWFLNVMFYAGLMSIYPCV